MDRCRSGEQADLSPDNSQAVVVHGGGLSLESAGEADVVRVHSRGERSRGPFKTGAKLRTKPDSAALNELDPRERVGDLTSAVSRVSVEDKDVEILESLRRKTFELLVRNFSAFRVGRRTVMSGVMMVAMLPRAPALRPVGAAAYGRRFPGQHRR